MSVRSKVHRTAVADYNDSMPGVVDVCILKREKNPSDAWMSMGDHDGTSSIVIGTREQAKQLIEALQSGIREIWPEDE
jgi:hypothetical protein